jgi:hypothetical protein
MFWECRILDIVDVLYNRFPRHPPPGPDGYKQFYPHPETIGSVDPGQYPPKPIIHSHPLFPKIKFAPGFGGYPIINGNPTVGDCYEAATWSDWARMGALSAVVPIHHLIYEKVPVVPRMFFGALSVAAGFSLLIHSSACTIVTAY